MNLSLLLLLILYALRMNKAFTSSCTKKNLLIGLLFISMISWLLGFEVVVWSTFDLEILPYNYLTEEKTYLLISAVLYHNADTQKEQISKDNRGKCGIYRWTQLENKKSYVGSAVNLSRRFYQYYSLAFLNTHKESSHIYKALLKHGYSKFSLEILEYCEPRNLLERVSGAARRLKRGDYLLEQYYLDLLHPEYNILKKAYSNVGYKHTEEQLTKIRKHLSILNPSPEQRARASVRMKKLSQFLASKANEAWKNNPSGSTRRVNIGLVHGLAVVILDPNKNILAEFDSQSKAKDFLNCSRYIVSKYQDSGKLFNSVSIGNVYITSKGQSKSSTIAVKVLNSNKELIDTCASLRETGKKYDIAVSTLRYSYLNKDMLYQMKYYFLIE